MGNAVFWIEGVLIAGGIGGWALWEYLKTDKLLKETRAREEEAKAKDEASETEA